MRDTRLGAMATDARSASVDAVAERDGFHDHLPDDADLSDESFVAAYRRLWAAARRRGALADAERELIGLALNAAVTHLNGPGIERHVRYALAAGAPPEHVLETLELASVLGIHSMAAGLPVILEELGVDVIAEPDQDQRTLKQEFIRRRGHWGEHWETLVTLDEEFLAAYLDFSATPWEHEGGLSPKLRELIYVAIDASTTHLHQSGIRTHARKAIAQGATLAELLEVLELTALLGMQTYVEGAAALNRWRAAENRGQA